jgi:hypothetical protein
MALKDIFDVGLEFADLREESATTAIPATTESVQGVPAATRLLQAATRQDFEVAKEIFASPGARAFYANGTVERLDQ